MHQVSRASNSITVSWPQPDQTNGNILDYQLRYYDQVGSRGGPWWGWWEVPGVPQWGKRWGDQRGASGPCSRGVRNVGGEAGGIGTPQPAGSEWLSPTPQAEDESHSFTLTSETNTATVTKLSPGHIYGFQVRARTAAGHGPYGGKVYFQTLPQGEGRPGWGGGGLKGW